MSVCQSKAERTQSSKVDLAIPLEVASVDSTYLENFLGNSDTRRKVLDPRMQYLEAALSMNMVM